MKCILEYLIKQKQEHVFVDSELSLCIWKKPEDVWSERLELKVTANDAAAVQIQIALLIPVCCSIPTQPTHMVNITNIITNRKYCSMSRQRSTSNKFKEKCIH